MVDRRNAVFRAIREYQDRGMMKWQGFFLSEHSQSLEQDKRPELSQSFLSLEEKLFLLNQLYISHSLARLTVVEDDREVVYEGCISYLTTQKVTLEADTLRTIALEKVLDIAIIEE